MAKRSNRNKHYRMHYSISGPSGYWWQKRKMIKADDVITTKNCGTHRYFKTLKLALRALQNVPVGSTLIRYKRHVAGRGHELEEW